MRVEQRRRIKMKFRSKAQRDGYVFGQLCKLVGTITIFPCLLFLGNEQTLINKGMIIPCIVSAVIMIYGVWRTGGIDYDK